jgi:hypothetical protein
MLNRLTDPATDSRFQATHPKFQAMYQYAMEKLNSFPSAIIFPEDFLPHKEIYSVSAVDSARAKKVVFSRRICHQKKYGGLFWVWDSNAWWTWRRYHENPDYYRGQAPLDPGHKVLKDGFEIVQAEHEIFDKMSKSTRWNSGDIFMPNREGNTLFEILGFRKKSWNSPITDCEFYLPYTPYHAFGSAAASHSAMFFNRAEATAYATIALQEMLK